jgi:hypothetical protein
VNLFFTMDGNRAQAGKPWPDRIGYVVGLLCARDIGRSMSLHDIAFLPGDEMRRRLDAALARIALAKESSLRQGTHNP